MAFLWLWGGHDGITGIVIMPITVPVMVKSVVTIAGIVIGKITIPVMFWCVMIALPVL